MNTFQVEVLFPEICNLYGELGNIQYIKRSMGERCHVIETHLAEVPTFLDKGKRMPDLIYMGTMTESSQRLVMEKLRPYREDIRRVIEDGGRFLVTGNALELFGDKIIDDPAHALTYADGSPIRGAEKNAPKEKFTTECLGIFRFHTLRDMMNRFNSLYIGEYDGLKVVGFKSQFTKSVYDKAYTPMLETDRGPGFDNQQKEEGIHYKNFMATYVIGPLFILNPDLMVKLLEEAGAQDVEPAFRDAAEEAYQARLKEYSDPARGFTY